MQLKIVIKNIFLSIIIGLYSTIVLSKTTSIENVKDGVTYDRLEELAQKRSDFSYRPDWGMFSMSIKNLNTYFLVLGMNGNDYSNRSWCEAAFFDNNYRYVNKAHINIMDHDDGNSCFYIDGISAVMYRKQPAMLITVTYRRGEPYRTANLYNFTALFVLTPHPDGSLSIRQDNSCLGAMNQIDTLAAAKKRIARCNQK